MLEMFSAREILHQLLLEVGILQIGIFEGGKWQHFILLQLPQHIVGSQVQSPGLAPGPRLGVWVGALSAAFVIRRAWFSSFLVADHYQIQFGLIVCFSILFIFGEGS